MVILPRTLSMLSLLFPLIILIAQTPAVQAESRGSSYVCNADRCASGITTVQIGAISTSPSIFLLPSLYTSTSPLASLIITTSTYLTNPLPLTSLSQSTITWLGSSTTGTFGSSALKWPLLVSAPTFPTAFSYDKYSGSSTSKSSFHNETIVNNSTLLASWNSLYVPEASWVRIVGRGGDAWVIREGGIPDRETLPGTGETVGGSNIISFGSDECPTSCGIGGTCVSSRDTASTSYHCACSPGFTGTTCSSCLPDHFGPSCTQCAGEGTSCGMCNDGIVGNGACIGVTGNSSTSCGCEHGTCIDSSTCECSAGWTTSVNATLKCSSCPKGLYEDNNSNCLACPLGTLTCSAADKSLTCITGWAIGASGTCVASGALASCVDGQYWTGTGCASCSPACTTCTGASASDCLKCASPRANLNGTCVGYDPSTGICDTSSTSLYQAFIVDNAKSKCDACPVGCLSCSIPNFSVSSTRSDLTCSACQEGYVLTNGLCQVSCGDGTFLPSTSTNATNGTCQACDTSVCKTCFSSATTCLTCTDTSSLSTPTGACVSTCPLGTYQLFSSRICASCPGDCSTCSASTDGSTATCLTCPPSRPALRNGRCEEVCPTTLYWDATTSKCSSCSSNCTSCIGPSSSQCLSCTRGSMLKAGVCEAATCASDGWVDSLGICFTALTNDGKVGKDATWWPYVVSVCLFGLVAGLGAFWWIKRERRRTRERTKDFGDALDHAEIGKKITVIRLDKLKGSTGESGSPTTPQSARSGLFTFFSARSPPASPLPTNDPPPRNPQLRALHLDPNRESFFSGAAAPPAYSPTAACFELLDAKAKDLQKRLSDYKQTGILDPPALVKSKSPSTSSPSRGSTLRWADLPIPAQMAEGSQRGSPHTEAKLETQETLSPFTRDGRHESITRTFKRSLSGTVSALQRSSIDPDSSWLFEHPGRATAATHPRLEAREEGGSPALRKQDFMEALNEGPFDDERRRGSDEYLRQGQS